MIFSRYKGVTTDFRRYWKRYGGWKEICLSPYFHASLVVAIIAYPLWLSSSWAGKTESIIPNILGFSLGGYAILLAFSNEDFLKILSTEDQHSPFLNLNSTFVHFISIQFLALILAISYNASPIESAPQELKLFLTAQVPYIVEAYYISKIAISFIGTTLFIYALMTAIAATMAIFRIAIWYDRHLSILKENEKPQMAKDTDLPPNASND